MTNFSVEEVLEESFEKEDWAVLCRFGERASLFQDLFTAHDVEFESIGELGDHRVATESKCRTGQVDPDRLAGRGQDEPSDELDDQCCPARFDQIASIWCFGADKEHLPGPSAAHIFTLLDRDGQSFPPIGEIEQDAVRAAVRAERSIARPDPERRSADRCGVRGEQRRLFRRGIGKDVLARPAIGRAPGDRCFRGMVRQERIDLMRQIEDRIRVGGELRAFDTDRFGHRASPLLSAKSEECCGVFL